LLQPTQQLGLIDVVHRRVLAGELRDMGSSAGSNMASPSLRTTNDMPIVQPDSFAAFGLIPFQINPHYVDAVAGSTHMGGCGSALFRRGSPRGEIAPGTDLSWLLQTTSRFDVR
jgi:dipeptidase E